MKISTKKTVEISLVLYPREARLLMAIVQNPPEGLGKDELEFFAALFELLKKEVDSASNH